MAVVRDAQEADLASRLEQEDSTDEKRKMSLIKIYDSDGVSVLSTASYYRIEKHLDELNIAEAAYLAGVAQLPTTIHQDMDPEQGTKRAHTVLYQMLNHDRITQEQYDEAVNTDITANPVEGTEEERADIDPEDPEYASYINVIKQELQKNEKFEGMELSEALASGLDIYTNMDADIQRQLQGMADNEDYYYNPKFQSEHFNIASSILDTETGNLVAITGG